ncbi:MAG: hypothetical protein RL407_2032 [Bacteroidota bacterium]|jgi:FHA domain
MKRLLWIGFFFLLGFTGAKGQSILIKNIDTKDYPKVVFQVADRNPTPWKRDEIQLEEDDVVISDLSFTPLEASTRPQKQVFLLFENSHFASFDPQRSALQALLKKSLSYFSEKDKLYFSEFDWTLANGKVLSEDDITEGNKSQIADRVEEINRPAASQKLHESTELNTALMEALEYLNKIPEDSAFDKAIVIFSSEFSNIYNSIHTPESIILSARQKNIPIYSVRYPRMGAKYSLEKITTETFGEHFSYDPSKELEPQAKSLGEIFQSINTKAAGNLYQLTYTTEKGPGDTPVALSLSKVGDTLRYEAFFSTPSYLAYVLMDGLRLGIASGFLLMMLILGAVVLVNRKKKKTQEKEANERKIQHIQEEAKQEREKQERFLEKLEKEQKEQREKEHLQQQQQNMQSALQASKARFEQLVRPPLLIGQDGSQHPVGMFNLLGRTQGTQTTLVLPDQTVSREHALILFERKGVDQLPESTHCFYFLDLGSSNGSFINEKQVVTPTPLTSGDFIRLGNVTFTFRQ